MEKKSIAQFGIIGLTEKSKSILLDMHNLGYIGCVYDFSHKKVEAFLENEAKDTKILGVESLEVMFSSLTEPRCIILLIEDLMIQDFVGVELTIEDFIDIELLPHMYYQDYILDARSFDHEDTKERSKDLLEKGIRYIGIKGNLSVGLIQGMCICLENESVWNESDLPIIPYTFGNFFQSELQKMTADTDIKSCCLWGVPGNKQLCIEFVIDKIWKENKRLIDEAKGILSKVNKLKTSQLCHIFRELCYGDLNLQEYESAAYEAKSEIPVLNEDQQSFVEILKKAMMACQIIHYARGFALIREIAEIHQWDIDYSKLKPSRPQLYHYKCNFYRKIKAAFTKNPQLTNLLLDEDFSNVVMEGLPSIKDVIARSSNISIEAFQGALGYYENLMTGQLLCARLFDKNFENEESVANLDLSPIYKYQHQLSGLQFTVEKIEETIEKIIEESKIDKKYRGLVCKCKIEQLHFRHDTLLEACIKHLENDQKVTSLHMNIFLKRIDHAEEISRIDSYTF